MKPSLAVIFLTLFSGSGFGLAALLALDNDFRIGGGFGPLMTAILMVCALALVTVGMISSTAHLANPKNAWRAFTRWRSSWLSRTVPRLNPVAVWMVVPFGLPIQK